MENLNQTGDILEPKEIFLKRDAQGRPIHLPGMDDPRYTVRIYLLRENRPKYWNFYCIYCGTKVCEIQGSVLYMADLTDEGVATIMRIRCNSRQCGGRPWFEFSI